MGSLTMLRAPKHNLSGDRKLLRAVLMPTPAINIQSVESIKGKPSVHQLILCQLNDSELI